MAIIEVDRLSKEFRLGALHGLKQTLLNTAARLSGKAIEERPLFKALDDISFSIEQGEVVGIIGHNGAGKSTLLKMLAKISTPTRGSVKVNGRIAPLIEVGAGFVPDFTGRENVYLNGAILGMSKREIDRKFDEIVDFAEMTEFIDTPVKRYSSGMQVKLAFAVATSIESEILIVDEVLAVGDLAFQRKCFDRMEHLIKRECRTVLLVSHNIRQVERLCARVILLKHGIVQLDGDPATVCRQYYQDNDDIILQAGKKASQYRQETSGDLEISDFQLQDLDGNAITSLDHAKPVIISFAVTNHKVLIKPKFGVGVHTTDLLYLATETSELALGNYDLPPGTHTIKCTIPSLLLLPGVYSFRLGIDEGDIRRNVYYQENIFHFKVSGQNQANNRALGFFPLNINWRIVR
jgi:ABC-type polysaccharide/polyol phosphate transport system ATPase subunit